MYDRFVAALRERLHALWEWLPALTLEFEGTRSAGSVSRSMSRNRAPIRCCFPSPRTAFAELTLFPGFEAEELTALLAVLRRAHHLNRDEDDLLTLFWEHVELYGLPLRGRPGRGDGGAAAEQAAQISASAVREDAELVAPTPADFEEALYFLDDSELRRLADELQQEFSRDLWADVLNALMDRMDDGDAERQQQIVAVLAEVLPMLLSGARFAQAASVLGDLVVRAGAEPALALPAWLGRPGAFRAVRAADDGC